MATGWWGGLTEQLSSMAKDVLTEGTEEIDDHATALQVEQKKTDELHAQNISIRGENEMLRSKVAELNDSLHSAEIQITSVSAEYKGLLQDREEELKSLKHTIEELNESNKSLLVSNHNPPERGRSHYHHFNQSEHSQPNGAFLEETEDITDVLLHQQEINRLNSELERSRAEAIHWKRESKRTATPQETATHSLTEEKEGLLQQIKSFEERLLSASDKHQQQLSALEDLHQQRLASVQQAHSTQLAELESRLAQPQQVTLPAGGEETESQAELIERVHQLEEEGEKLYEQLQRSQDELRIANEKIAEHLRQTQEQQGLHKKQLHELQEEKMREQAAEVSLTLEQKIRECEEQRKELEELREENSSFNQSLTDLDREHELYVAELVEQRDSLRHDTGLLTVQLSEQQERCVESAQELVILRRKLELQQEKFVQEAEERQVLTQQLRECQLQLDTVQKMNSQDLQQADDIEKEKMLMKSEISRLELRLSEADNSFSQSQAELLEMTSNLNQLEACNKKLGIELEESTARNLKLDQVVEQFKLSTDDLKRQISQSAADIGQLKNDLDQSEQRTHELSLKLNQAEESKDRQELDLSKSQQGSLEKPSESDLQREYDSVQQRLKSSLEENSSLKYNLDSLMTERDSALASLSQYKLNNSAFQQTISDLKLQSEESLSSISSLTKDLSSKDSIISSLTAQLKETEANLKDEAQKNISLADETRLLVTREEKLKKELSDSANEASSLKARLIDATSELSKLRDNYKSNLLDLEQAQTQLDSRNHELDSLSAELDASIRAKVLAESEVAELTSQLASSSIDSEPPDPEPSEEALEASRDSDASITEVQELKTQLAELQELLAQKVLLINELKGGEEEDMTSASNPAVATQSLSRDSCLQASMKNEVCKHEIQLVAMSAEKDGVIEEKELKLTNINSELSSLKDQLSHVGDLEEQLGNTENECGRLKQALEGVQGRKRELDEALQDSSEEIKRLKEDLSQAESEASLKLSRELTIKQAEVDELEQKVISQELVISQLTQDSQAADKRLRSQVSALQLKLDSQDALISTTSECLREKEEELASLQAAIGENTALMADLAEKDEAIERLHDQLSIAENSGEQVKITLSESRDCLEQLQSTVAEKDATIAQLRDSQRLVGSSHSSPPNFTSYTDPSALAEQVRSMEVEREQMSGVLSEKSREITTLKKQLQSLMDASSSRNVKDAETAEMTKTTIRKLSAIVNERDVEIEALKQKNESLVSILQSNGGASVSSDNSQQVSQLLEQRQQLSQQLAALTSEREQLFSALQIKHQEAVTFHQEAVRLAGLLEERGSGERTVGGEGELERLQSEYHERKQQLVETQHKLSEYKQKCSELSMQLEAAVQSDHVPKSAYESLKQEGEALKARLEKQKEALLEKDKTYQDMQLRLSSEADSHSSLQSECGALRKQIENLTFELSETRAERDDKTDSEGSLREQLHQCDSTIKTLQASELELQRSLKDRERELTQFSNQKGVKEESRDAEQERLLQQVSALTLERDTAHLTAQQNYQACEELQKSLHSSKDRVQKLEREVERLRSHLVSIEEGYTTDLLQSEEREKELRNKLANAEEKAAHTSTAVQQASLEASRQLSSMEEQLHAIAAERDNCLLELSKSQDQCSQYSTQLTNLEGVLEQFQKEKDSMHMAEVQKLRATIANNNTIIVNLQSQLSTLQGQLDGQCEALEAAQRLTQQLEKKEEAMDALRDEVGLREASLREAEERIRRLSSNNESKVEKLLVKNLIINWNTAPDTKKPEVLMLIGRVLNFTEEEKIRVGLGEHRGWLGGIWQKIAHPVPTTPSTPNPHDKSFSEMFVKFLESESTPKPAPLPLPVDRMVEEEKVRAEQHHRAAFNPFIAPTASTSSGAAASSHPLLAGVTRDGSPLYSASQPTGNPLTLSPQPASQLSVGQVSSNQHGGGNSALQSVNPLSGQQFSKSLSTSQSGALSLTPIPSSAGGDNSVRFIPITANSTPLS